MNELWKSVLAEIEVEVSKATYAMFFKGTELDSIDGSVATIIAPTAMMIYQIEKKYYALVKRILDKKTGENVSLTFRIGASRPLSSASVGPLFSEAPTISRPQPSRIKKDYTLESFAVSETNQLAFTVAQTVAATPGTRYNPVFFYGSVGVGKTHLMHGIANEIYQKNNEANVLYLTTEDFTNEIVEAIRGKTTTQMRKKFRNVDLLLLDDIQFLSGKDKVQEELFHTFNSLIEKGAQIAFSSDRPPSELQKIEARLASRFEGGLTVDIEPPDFELRTAILLTKSEKFDLEFSIDMAKLAAERITDTRALEGFLLRLSSFMNMQPEKEVNEQLILKLLGKKVERSQILKPDQIIDSVCAFYNIKSTQLKGKKRDAFLVRPRHICMYLLKEESGMTFVEIGNILGGRDHTTVMHAVEKISQLLANSTSDQEEVGNIKQKMKEDFLS
jgi:chromosomal replication initiator protein